LNDFRRILLAGDFQILAKKAILRFERHGGHFMGDGPCEDEKDRAMRAAQAWEIATEEVRRFMVDKPLEPEEAIEPKTPEYLEEMDAAFEREAQAREEYIAAMSAWFECEEGSS
jgi:hypothetical protein